MKLRLPLLIVLVLGHFATPTLPAADQTAAETTKRPVKAQVVGGVKAENAEKIGNIEVTYADGTKDRWTTKGDCGLPRVAPDGTVGWTVYGPETKIAASYTMRPNATVAICRQGKVLCRAQTGLPFVEEWGFVEGGKQFAVKTRAAHRPASVELHDTQSGKRLAEVRAGEGKLPKWAEPYRE